MASECAEGTDSLTEYFARAVGKCQSGTFDFSDCNSKSFTIAGYADENCKDVIFKQQLFFEHTNCEDDDDDGNAYGDTYGGDDDTSWEITAEAASCYKSGSSDDAALCFHSASTVELEGGEMVVMSALRVGDRVLTVTDLGERVFADVVFLPHSENAQAAEFVTVQTTGGKTVRMTREHLIPSGSCASVSEHTLMSAATVQTGMCVQTVEGLEEVVSVSSSSDRGIATVVTSEGAGMVVVDGVVASSFGAHHGAPNAYYHVHRSLFRVLKAAGVSVSGVLGHELAVKANLAIGDVAYSVGRVFGIV